MKHQKPISEQTRPEQLERLLIKAPPARHVRSGPIRSGLLLLCLLLGVLSVSGCNDWLTKDVFLGVNPDDIDDDNDNDNPDAADDDGDGLSNDVEESVGTEPRQADTDQDGFSDGLELVLSSGDPLDGSVRPIAGTSRRRILPEDAFTNTRDSDGDGLGDGYEESVGLDPNDPDTDGDGYSDGLELLAGSNPFLRSDVPTRDGAPIPDGVDRTGPAPVDTDGDGLSDEIEARNGTNSTSTDTDSDGFSDSIELLAGSDPTDPLENPNFSVPPPPSTDDTNSNTNQNENDNSNENANDNSSL